MRKKNLTLELLPMPTIDVPIVRNNFRASVIVVTYNRPEQVRTCVESVLSQKPPPFELIVIDASTGNETERALSEFSGIAYVHVDFGYGNMTKARNLGLRQACGDIAVFIDDDAVAHDGWLASMVEPYHDQNVGAVGGRALNLQPGEEAVGLGQIGRLNDRGELTGFFAADPGSVISVDHIIGCNMSFRLKLLRQLGGLREYPGTELREDTDPCLRIRSLGYRILFTPFAVVDHVGAPHPHQRFKRFDLRYEYFAHHNHSLLLVRNFGIASRIVWIGYFHSLSGSTSMLIRKLGAALGRFSLALAGATLGLTAGLFERLAGGRQK